MYSIYYKSKWSARSVPGSEMMALANSFDIVYTLKHDLAMILKANIPLRMLTDSKSLFYLLTKAFLTTEMRLTIDNQTFKGADHAFELNETALFRSGNNVADVFTETKENSILLNTIVSGKLNLIQQKIVSLQKWKDLAERKMEEWGIDQEFIHTVRNYSFHVWTWMTADSLH